VKIIAVVGTGSGCGKTTVVCRILRAIPGLGAVKISPREGTSRVEWGAGEPGKDTALFVGSGAVRVARIIGPRNAVGSTWDLIKDQFEGCQGVVIEGASALGLPGERLVVFVPGSSEAHFREDKNRAIAENSSIIVERSPHFDINLLVKLVRTFLTSQVVK
jgi:molybdopterin-guanine dinucleotide biosynthesis protein